MAHCSFSSMLPGRWRDGAAVGPAADASLLSVMPSRRVGKRCTPGDRRRPVERRRRSALDPQPTQALTKVSRPGCVHLVGEETTGGIVLLLKQMLDWALGEESEEDEAEAVLFFIIRTSSSKFRVGGRPGESIADLLARVVRLAMMPEHGGLAGASVRVCTAGGRALGAGTSLLEVKSQELVLADEASDDRVSFDGHADHLGVEHAEHSGRDDRVEGGGLQPDHASEAFATSFVQDPDLGPAVLISTAGTQPQGGSDTLLCNLQF